MRAAVLRTQGPPEVLKVEADFPAPKRGRGEVLVKVAAAAVNPVDVKTRAGLVPRAVVAKPKILGADVAGIVEEADEGSAFKKGDRVFACTGQHVFTSRYGTYAELVSAKEETLAPLPEGLSFEQAAAVPLAAMTAWQALETRMPLEGKSVLVHAGAGGVGSFAVQIAHAQGARVTATCGPSNVDVVKGLGADTVVDYTKDRFEEVAPGPYDAVLDTISGDYEPRSLALVRPRGPDGDPGGVYVGVIAHGWTSKLGKARGTAQMVWNTAKGALLSALRRGPEYRLVIIQSIASRGLHQVADLIRAGQVKPLIDRVVPLEQVSEAHAHVEAGHARGKVVIKVADL